MTDEAEAREDQAELARHHRDFQRIRILVHGALEYESVPMLHADELIKALREIRGIVG